MGVNGGLSNRDERAFAALVNVGPSVLSGIFCSESLFSLANILPFLLI
jgi:hypothetical protein